MVSVELLAGGLEKEAGLGGSHLTLEAGQTPQHQAVAPWLFR